MSGSTPFNEQQAQLQQAFFAHLPTITFNGFTNSMSGTEITSVVSFGTKPLVTLVMAPAVAKTFALAILDTVDQYQKATGITVPTLQELSERLSDYQADNP